MRNTFRVLAGATLAAVLSTCGGAPSESGRGDAPDPSARPPVERNSTPLQTSAPEAQEVDSEKLEAAYRQAETLQPLLSLLVLRNNALVGEAYLHGADSDTAYNIKSVSKSILSALTGIALREGFVKDLEQPISEFFPEYFEAPPEHEGWTKMRAKTDSFKRRVNRPPPAGPHFRVCLEGEPAHSHGLDLERRLRALLSGPAFCGRTGYEVHLQHGRDACALRFAGANQWNDDSGVRRPVPVCAHRDGSPPLGQIPRGQLHWWRPRCTSRPGTWPDLRSST